MHAYRTTSLSTVGYYETKSQTAALSFIAKAGSIVEEVVSSIRTVKAFGSSAVLGKRFNKDIDSSRKASVDGALPQAMGLGLMSESQTLLHT